MSSQILMSNNMVTAQKKFFIKNFFGFIKSFPITKLLKNFFRKLRIWSHLLKQSFLKNFVFLCCVSNRISLRSIFLRYYKDVWASFVTLGMMIKKLKPLTINVPHHIETSQLICNAIQLTGFYMMGNTGR